MTDLPMMNIFQPTSGPGKERLAVSAVIEGEDVERFRAAQKRLGISTSKLAAQAIHFALVRMGST